MLVAEYIIRFSNVTKYRLTDFLERYQEFFDNDYTFIDQYFSGLSETVDHDRLRRLQKLLTDCKELQAQFKNYANRFDNCGYWLLMEWIDDLITQVEKVVKLPKFRRTTLTVRNYKPVIQVESTIGAQRTMEDLSTAIQSSGYDRVTWEQLMLDNDLEEDQWEIDELVPVTAMVNNITPAAVRTILEPPVGEQVYGKDIARKITIEVEEEVNTKAVFGRSGDETTVTSARRIGDLKIVKYKDNIDQKVMILMGLRRGTVPDNPLLGVDPNLTAGVTAAQLSLPTVRRQQVDTFLQDDLFESVDMTAIEQVQDGLVCTLEIKTKYNDKVTKKVKL